ncbi:MAG: glycerophosphodiester phosphodiesterase [Pseudohongiellaceae bacterium]
MSILARICLLSGALISFASAEPLVIAHRGASGYLPEHTLAAKVLAHAQGADYIEQDVVMTRDDALVVLHDLTLDRVTDVVARFPGRARADGRHYVVDFTLAELRELQVGEPEDPLQSGKAQRAGRFPPGFSRFGIHTLAEEIDLIQGLNRTLGREAGLYVELKAPWFHHAEGKDLARAVLQELQRHGYQSKDAPVFLQSFDYPELQRVQQELLPALGMQLRLVQLIADNAWGETQVRSADGSMQPFDYAWMHAPEGLMRLATTVDGIGPALDMVLLPSSTAGRLQFSSLVTDAHAAGLLVHPYTFRAEPVALPSGVASFEELVAIFLWQVGVDGVFTDFPDRALQVRAAGAP